MLVGTLNAQDECRELADDVDGVLVLGPLDGVGLHVHKAHAGELRSQVLDAGRDLGAVLHPVHVVVSELIDRGCPDGSALTHAPNRRK